MWNIDTHWFDVAFVMTIFAVGNILFGRFEEHKPRWQRLLKVAITLPTVLLFSMTLGRVWAYSLLGIPLLGALWIHLFWLPKHGINGWTAEPRDKYLALVMNPSIRRKNRVHQANHNNAKALTSTTESCQTCRGITT